MRVWATALSAALFFTVPPAFAAPVLVSGGDELVFIDGDDNGPTANDCILRADITGTNLTVTPQQQMDSSPLLVCAGPYSGFTDVGQDESSDYIEFDVQTGPANVSEVPLYFEIFDEQPTPNGPPVRMDGVDDKFEIEPAGGGDPLAQAIVCNSGEPAGVVSFPDGPGIMVPLRIETIEDDRFLVIEDRPFGIAPTGESALPHNAYVRLTEDDRLTMALADAPSELLVDIDFANLPTCGATTMAPTATAYGLAALSLLLLLGGVLVLRRQTVLRLD